VSQVGGLIGEVMQNPVVIDRVLVGEGSNVASFESCTDVGGLIGSSTGDIDLTNSTSQADVACLTESPSTTSPQFRGTGGIVGNSAAKLNFSNVTMAGDLQVPQMHNIGGIVGRQACPKDQDPPPPCRVQFTNVAMHGDQVTGSADTGGIIGKADQPFKAWHELRNVRSKANVTGKDRIGGIFGTMFGVNQLVDVENTGQVTLQGSGRVGGIGGVAKFESSASPQAVARSIQNSGRVVQVGADNLVSYVGGLYGTAYRNSGSLAFVSHLNKGAVQAETKTGHVGGMYGAVISATASFPGSFTFDRIAGLGAVTAPTWKGINGALSMSCSLCTDLETSLYYVVPSLPTTVIAGPSDQFSPFPLPEKPMTSKAILASNAVNPATFAMDIFGLAAGSNQYNTYTDQLAGTATWIFDGVNLPTLALPPMPVGYKATVK
jgi:hypothetical protein